MEYDLPPDGKLAIWGGMNVLALEFSTETASLALLADGAVVAVQPVDASSRRSQGLFDAAAALLAGAGWTFREIGAVAVGRGPGAYTGLRVSLTAAHGWALPDHKPVWTVSSAAALAADFFAERPQLAQVVVSGVARRGTLWAGLFERGKGPAVHRVGAWKLLPAEAWGREWPGAHWIERSRPPRAEWVGKLFFAGDASEELQPIYLHPAVTAAPRFDAEGRPLA